MEKKGTKTSGGAEGPGRRKKGKGWEIRWGFELPTQFFPLDLLFKSLFCTPTLSALCGCFGLASPCSCPEAERTREEKFPWRMKNGQMQIQCRKESRTTHTLQSSKFSNRCGARKHPPPTPRYGGLMLSALHLQDDASTASPVTTESISLFCRAENVCGGTGPWERMNWSISFLCWARNNYYHTPSYGLCSKATLTYSVFILWSTNRKWGLLHWLSF